MSLKFCFLALVRNQIIDNLCLVSDNGGERIFDSGLLRDKKLIKKILINAYDFIQKKRLNTLSTSD